MTGSIRMSRMGPNRNAAIRDCLIRQYLGANAKLEITAA